MCSRIVFNAIRLPKFTLDRTEYEEPKDEIDQAIDALANFGEPEIDITDWPNIRQMLAQNMIKEMMDEEDRRFLETVKGITG